jgi:hypothetical protein
VLQASLSDCIHHVPTAIVTIGWKATVLRTETSHDWNCHKANVTKQARREVGLNRKKLTATTGSYSLWFGIPKD